MEAVASRGRHVGRRRPCARHSSSRWWSWRSFPPWSWAWPRPKIPACRLPARTARWLFKAIRRAARLAPASPAMGTVG